MKQFMAGVLLLCYVSVCTQQYLVVSSSTADSVGFSGISEDLQGTPVNPAKPIHEPGDRVALTLSNGQRWIGQEVMTDQDSTSWYDTDSMVRHRVANHALRRIVGQDPTRNTQARIGRGALFGELIGGMTCSLFVVTAGGIPYFCGFLGILGAIPGAIIGIFNNSASGGEDIYWWFTVPDTTSQECHVSAVQG